MSTPKLALKMAWNWAVPAMGLLLLALVGLGLTGSNATWALIVAIPLLAGSIFAAVHHAEALAHRVGEPFGSIILALAVTIIEVAMIASIMLSGAEGGESVARDTVFSAVMIVLNGVIGLCLVVGGRRFHEQRFKLNAASSALAVLGVLAVLTLVLPNFTVSGGARQYSTVHMAIISVATLFLYGTFLFVQTVRHREDFLDRDGDVATSQGVGHSPPPSLLASVLLLPTALFAVILLAKLLSHPLDTAIEAAGLPQAFVGVVIAAIVLTPEAIASTRAAIQNRLQSSVNLALGSALASIGLTIPVIVALSIATGQPLVMGVPTEQMVLLVLTLFVATITLGTGRTTVLQGAVHLTLFAVFLMLSAVP